MKTPARASVLLLVASAFAAYACSGDDGGPSDPDPQVGSIRATVTADGDALPAVTVRLFADGGANPITSAATAANGQVTFAGRAAGSYDVDIVVPAGFELGAGQTVRRDVTVEDDETATVTFALEEIVVPPTEGQLRARVVEGSGGVDGVEVALFASGGSTPLETGTTGADGRVLFDGLAPGTFDVEITMPANFEIAAGDEVRKAVTVTAGTTTDVQFGIESTLAAAVEVDASGTSFTPADITIEPGTTVRWVKGVNPHTVTPTGHSEWSAATLDQAGEVFEHTFEDVGTFNYFCEFHDGMTGVVHVAN